MTEGKIKEQLLQKLNEYSESLLDNDYSRIRLKKSKKTVDSFNFGAQSDHLKTNRRRKKKEKKKKQREQQQNLNKNDKDCDNGSELKGVEKTLHELKSELGLEDFEQRLQSEKFQKDNKNIPKKKEAEVVVYENPSKRKRKTEVNQPVTTKQQQTETEDEFDIKKARFEVRKYGIKGFEVEKKESAMVSLLVELGARPPKNKYYNYKEFIQMKKNEKEEQKKQREIDRSLGLKVAKSGAKRRKRDRNDVGGYVDGQVGTYKHGVQFVQKTDLKGFDKKKRK